MATWDKEIEEYLRQDSERQGEWISGRLTELLQEVSRQRQESNVLLYGSGFLQKPHSKNCQISPEDINGLMSILHGMDWQKPLNVILHTPGGSVNAAESIVAYLRSKFQRIDVIVPTFAISAGTMISLASDSITMGRQSQLGPIDPQMLYRGTYVSAQAIVDQFNRANREILDDNSNRFVWQPILASLGPSLIQEAQNALEYGEEMVRNWLEQYMFKCKDNRAELSNRVAQHFNDATAHKSHGRRIDRQEACDLGLHIISLEANQELQEAVLTAYHILTIVFERSPATKVLWSNRGRTWIKEE